MLLEDNLEHIPMNDPLDDIKPIIANLQTQQAFIIRYRLSSSLLAFGSRHLLNNQPRNAPRLGRVLSRVGRRSKADC